MLLMDKSAAQCIALKTRPLRIILWARHVQLARQETERAHAWKQIEQDFRQADWRDIASTCNKKLPINCVRVLVLRGFARAHSEICVVLSRAALKSA
jgi:hypothetical protein